MLQLARFVAPITAVLLFAVGLDLTWAGLRRVRERPRLLIAGLIAPPLVLAPFALGLVRLFAPPPSMAVGLLLVAMCPIGGISNTYSYLARASTGLSVTLTGLSCLLGAVTVPAAGMLFRLALHDASEFEPPIVQAIVHALAVLVIPVGLGMWVRHRWPDWAAGRRPMLQRLSLVGIAALLAAVIATDAPGFARQFVSTAALATTFILGSMLVGWGVSTLAGASRPDRFTLMTEFATRNLAVATAVAIGALGRVEFALFAAIYFLTEVPVMLLAVMLFRRRTGAMRRP